MVRRIEILGLGAGDLEQLPVGVYKKLLKANSLFLRTKEHPVVAELEKEGLGILHLIRSMKNMINLRKYMKKLSRHCCKRQKETIVYAVPGHPLVAERTVQLLLEYGPKRDIEIILAVDKVFLMPYFTR